MKLASLSPACSKVEGFDISITEGPQKLSQYLIFRSLTPPHMSPIEECAILSANFTHICRAGQVAAFPSQEPTAVEHVKFHKPVKCPSFGEGLCRVPCGPNQPLEPEFVAKYHAPVVCF
jgi:hypothetical protein